MSNSLTQYISLFEENRDLICGNSAPALNAPRSEALDIVRSSRLPDKNTEGFEKTSIEDMFAPDYGVNISRVNIPVDVAASFRCDVPSLSTLLAFVINDSFHPTSKLESKLPEGVIFGSLKRIAEEKPSLIEKYYNTVAPAENPSVALNTLLAQDGVMIYVPKGVRVERPLQLVNVFSSPVPLAAFRRILIVLEEGAELQLLVCDHTQNRDKSYLAAQVSEVILGEGSRLEVCSIEESSEKTSRYSRLFTSGKRIAFLVQLHYPHLRHHQKRLFGLAARRTLRDYAGRHGDRLRKDARRQRFRHPPHGPALPQQPAVQICPRRRIKRRIRRQHFRCPRSPIHRSLSEQPQHSGIDHSQNALQTAA